MLPASILERDVLRARVPGLPPRGPRHAAGRGRARLDRPRRSRRARRPDRALSHGRRCRADPRAARAAAGRAFTTASASTSPRRGASFFAEIHDAAGGGLAEPALEALWDLAWAGEVTSDTLAPLRARLASRAAARPTGARASRASARAARCRRPRSAAGASSLLAERAPSPTERLKALAEQLLKRHGVLTRDAVAFEALPGGFAAVYPVLRALEEAGRIRRGYFVTGLGGLQFAEPGALEALRSAREAGSRGAAGRGAGRGRSREPLRRGAAVAEAPRRRRLFAPRRSPRARSGDARGAGRRTDRGGAEPARASGRAAAPGGRSRRAPASGPPRPRALARWCEATGRGALGWAVGEAPSLADGPLGPFLAAAGFVRAGPGYRLPSLPAPSPDEDDGD